MDTCILNELVKSSGLNKFQIAEQSGISRTTLDNVLAGADAKISTIESLAKVLGVKISQIFGEVPITPIEDSEEIESYKKEIQRLSTLLDKQKRSTKVVVELDVDEEEFIKLGLKEKIVQVLSK